MRQRRRISDLDHLLVRFTAVVHMFVGGVLIVASGLVLFALPPWAFWAVFWLGMYLFLPGAIITFRIVNKDKSHKWARYMIPLWKLLR
jgi:hypothetical protein